jgi:hypothetical protein
VIIFWADGSRESAGYVEVGRYICFGGELR